MKPSGHRMMTPADYSCPVCEAGPGRPCTTQFGGQKTDMHSERKVLAPARTSLRVRLDRTIAHLVKAQIVIQELRRELSEHKAEITRLRRLLRNMDMTVVHELHRQLDDAHEEITRLKAKRARREARARR